MNSEQIYEAITNLPEELPEEAAAHTFIKRKRSYWRWGAAAAAVALIPLAAAAILFSGGMGGMSSGSSAEMAQDSDPQEDGLYGSASYMDYAGPVFPLATLGGAEDLAAERTVTFDFSPYETRQETYESSSGESQSYDRYDTEIAVTDAYVLTNPTEEDVTVTAAYPFAASFSDPLDFCPVITVDGAEAETALYAGPYRGDVPESWETYRAWLSDGSYREAALASVTALDVPVIVYEFSALAAPEGDAPNPTLSVRMTLDYDRTTVLSLGFDGGSWDRENGVMIRECSVPQEGEMDYGESKYLIVLGEDVADMTLRGCRSGGSWEESSEDLPGVTANVRRYPSTLQAELQKLVDELYDGEGYWQSSGGEARLLAALPRQTYLDALTELLLSYGVLADDPAERSRCELLEDVMGEVWSADRVLYLTFPVTVPAGSSVAVTAKMVKDASRDYAGGGAAREGYDLVTRLGSDLTFTSQTARLAGAEYVEIVRQNFGFDPERGVTEVTLDPAAEHYFIEVRKREG